VAVRSLVGVEIGLEISGDRRAADGMFALRVGFGRQNLEDFGNFAGCLAKLGGAPTAMAQGIISGFAIADIRRP
jgi:hypothetical protein